MPRANQSGARPVEGLMPDLRDAFRALRATPIVTLVAILSLALGIGANTAIFSIVNSLMLRTLPVASPERLFLVNTGPEARSSWTNPIWEQIRDRQQVFAGALAWSSTRFNLAEGGQTEFVDGVWASGGYFDVLGVTPLLGRTFRPEDDRRGGGPDGPVAVISYSFWQRRYGGEAGAIGRSLVIERVPYTIIGVTPPEFFGTEVGRAFEVAIPLGTEPLIRGKESGLDSGCCSRTGAAGCCCGSCRLRPAESFSIWRWIGGCSSSRARWRSRRRSCSGWPRRSEPPASTPTSL